MLLFLFFSVAQGRPLGPPALTVEIVCQENHGQGANFRSYH